jgi:SAM-dependent methyltransferase
MIPYPPASLQLSVGAPSLENFLIVADGWVQVINRFLEKPSSLLDIGCGCGRIARFLVPQQLVVKYVGFDVILRSIEWCNKFISSRYPNARFIHSDIYSKEYNPDGTIISKNYQFPVEDESIDIAFAGSVFTHLLVDDAQNYLKETYRCLKRGSVAILSIHNELASKEHPFVGTEARIDILDEYVIKMCEKEGFYLHAKQGKLCGQEIYVFKK